MPARGPRTIVYVHATDVLAGGERSLLNLIRHLDPGTFRTHVVCDATDEFADSVKALGTSVDRESFPGLRPPGLAAWRAARRLAHHCRRTGGALLHANTPRTNLYAAAAGRLAGIPVIWHCRNLLEAGMWDTDRRFAWLADCIICNSAAIAARFKGSHWQNRVRVILNGVSLEEFDPNLSGESVRGELSWPSLPIIAATSRLDPEKGHEALLEAMRIVAARHCHARLVIVGCAAINPTERHAQLQHRIDEARLAGVARLLGYRRDMPQILAAADLCVLPAEAEACGRVLFEAMAMAKPVVATASGGTPEIVVDGITGILVPPNDPPTLAEALLQLLENPVRARAMGIAGREHVVKHFSIQTHVQSTMQVYSEVLDF